MHENDPYRSPASSLEHLAPTDDLVPADRLVRLGAVLIDGMLGMVLTLPLVFAGLYFSGIFTGETQPWMVDAMQGGGLNYALQFGIAGVGFVLFVALQGYPLAKYGQTWAKRWLDIRIVDLQGRKPQFGRLLMLRYAAVQLASMVPCLGVLFALTDALFIFREDQRCVHDLMAGTRVVKGSPDATPTHY